MPNYIKNFQNIIEEIMGKFFALFLLSFCHCALKVQVQIGVSGDNKQELVIKRGLLEAILTPDGYDKKAFERLIKTRLTTWDGVDYRFSKFAELPEKLANGDEITLTLVKIFPDFEIKICKTHTTDDNYYTMKILCFPGFKMTVIDPLEKLTPGKYNMCDQTFQKELYAGFEIYSVKYDVLERVFVIPRSLILNSESHNFFEKMKEFSNPQMTYCALKKAFELASGHKYPDYRISEDVAEQVENYMRSEGLV